MQWRQMATIFYYNQLIIKT